MNSFFFAKIFVILEAKFKPETKKCVRKQFAQNNAKR